MYFISFNNGDDVERKSSILQKYIYFNFYLNFIISCFIPTNTGEVYQQAIIIELSTRWVGATKGVSIIREKTHRSGR